MRAELKFAQGDIAGLSAHIAAQNDVLSALCAKAGIDFTDVEAAKKALEKLSAELKQVKAARKRIHGEVRGVLLMNEQLHEALCYLGSRKGMSIQQMESLDAFVTALSKAVVELAQCPFPLHNYVSKDTWEFACRLVAGSTL